MLTTVKKRKKKSQNKLIIPQAPVGAPIDDEEIAYLPGEPTNQKTLFEIGIGGDIMEVVRLVVLEIKLVVHFIVSCISAVFGLIVWALGVIVTPIFLWFCLGLFLLYLSHIFWPWFVDFVWVVVIPVVKVLIIITNFLLEILILVLRIVFMVWNILVPFIGLLIGVVIDLFVTVMNLVFEAIGSINWEPFITAVMNIVYLLVDMACKILTVLIKVGIPVISALVKVIGKIIEVVMGVVKIILPIITWILELLFKILEPILQILAIFFGGGGGGSSASSNAARKLLSLNQQRELDTREDLLPYVSFVTSTLNVSSDIFFTQGKQHNVNTWNSGRTPKSLRQPGLPPQMMSVSESDWGDGKEEVDVDAALDQDEIGHVLAHTIYRHARGMESNDMDRAMDSMNAIREFQRTQNPLSLRHLMDYHHEIHGHKELPHDRRLGSLDYGVDGEHPEVMHDRLSRERELKRQEMSQNIYKGRGLLDYTIYPEDANDHLNNYMNQLEQEHAHMIVAQTKSFREKNIERMQIVTIISDGTSEVLRKHAETTLHPDNIFYQWNTMLKQFGYQSVWEMHAHFLETHKDAAGFINYLSSYFDNPMFNFFRNQDDSVNENNPYFHDWVLEQRKMANANTGRRLFQAAGNDPDVAGTGESKSAAADFPVISNKNCFSKPTHPMCAPNIPPTFKPQIPVPEFSNETKQKFYQDVSVCWPWYNHFYGVYGWQRAYNALVSVWFIVLAIWPINCALATLTLIGHPWMGWLIDWVFIVPKFKIAGFSLWWCWVNHLWDLVSTILVIYILTKLAPFWDALVAAWGEVWQIKAKPPVPDPRVAVMDAYWSNFTANHVPADPMDAALTGNRISNKLNIENHHHHYGPTEMKSAEELEYDETIRRIKQLLNGVVDQRAARRRLHDLHARVNAHYGLEVAHEDEIDTIAYEEERRLLQSHPVNQALLEYDL